VLFWTGDARHLLKRCLVQPKAACQTAFVLRLLQSCFVAVVVGWCFGRQFLKRVEVKGRAISDAWGLGRASSGWSVALGPHRLAWVGSRVLGRWPGLGLGGSTNFSTGPGPGGPGGSTKFSAAAWAASKSLILDYAFCAPSCALFSALVL